MPERPLFEQLDQAIDFVLAGGVPPGELADLADIAAKLRDLPDENFKSRLKDELERRALMPATATVSTAKIPEGFRTVTPYISLVEGDKFIEFLKQAFDAKEVLRHPSGPDAFHAQLRIRDSMLMVYSGEAARGHEWPAAFHFFVDDCDATFNRAIAAGAISRGEPDDRPYGERSAFAEDAFGNWWYIATRFPSNKAPEGAGSLVPYLHPAKARPFIEFLKQAFDAEETFFVEHGGRVMHAAVRIGDATLEMGEAPNALPSGFFIYVADVDAVYRRAIEAGAASIRPPMDQPYGQRDAVLLDPFGHTWHPAMLI
jgi:uncharacterized glyoxalase superfamily protein PhnB